MKEGKSDLKSLVIKHHAEARITYQLATQLEPLLPIQSFKDVMARLGKEIMIDKQSLQTEMFVPYIPEDLFPIKDVKDLVAKISTATHIALATIAKPSSDNIEQSAVLHILATGLSTLPGRQTPIPAGHFTGPSLFGSSPLKK